MVEDSAEDAELIVGLLRQEGFQPEWRRVETPAAAEEALARESWDLVICDYLLPPATGIDVLRAVRSRSPELPLIFVSGKMGEEAAVEAMRAGAGMLAKPFGPEALLRAVRTAVAHEGYPDRL